MVKRININISDDMHEAIKQLSKERGATLSGLIRVVLGDWLEKEGFEGNWDVDSPGGHRPGSTADQERE